MANYPTQPYSLLEDRFKALTGLASLQKIDKQFLRDLVNRRVRMAFERYPWPIFTVVGEPVVLTSKTVITFNGSGSTNTALAKRANTVFRVHDQNPETIRYPDELTFVSETDVNGNPSIRIVEPFKGQPGDTVYVTYRKDITEEVNAYGATTGYYGYEVIEADEEAGIEASSDNPDVPWLFFEYAVHGSHADFLRGDGQHSKAIQEDQYAESLLQEEIDKISNQGRQFRHDVLQFRPPSQFRRHNIEAGGAPVAPQTAELKNNP